MPRISILQSFKDGTVTYHAGDLITVSDADAARFCAYGWAAAPGLVTGEPNTEPQTLEVHTAYIGQRAATLGA